VIAPSESIGEVLRERGVTTPITAIPTGIHKERFAHGNGPIARRRYGIPDDAFVVGHVGRLAPEKNLEFLARSVAIFLRANAKARFLVVGSGPSVEEINRIFRGYELLDRLHHPDGALDGQDLADAYHAMDVFAFASKSETQGMVLAEATTAGVPVVALDAAGAREVVCDGVNGRLLLGEDEEALAAALSEITALGSQRRQELIDGARRTAEEFSMPRCATRVLELYEHLLQQGPSRQPTDDAAWAALLRLMEEEWNIWSGVRRAVGEALLGTEERDRAAQ
jgi:glycosyltransferase involved in cell wall biosynthesis